MPFDLYKKEVIGDATEYIRPYQTISNGPIDGPNSLTIFEEKIVVLSDASTRKVALDTAELQVIITDPNQSFDLIHPVTGAVTGTKTFAELKIEMYSLYLHLAAIRDQAEEEEEEGPLPS